MALIVISVHDTLENERTVFTCDTLQSILDRVNLDKHRLAIVDNDSCRVTKKLFESFSKKMAKKYGNSQLHIFQNSSNIGTAKAVNRGLSLRMPDEYCIKMDNDAVINLPDWPAQMEDVMRRMPQIGILGLKRVDLQESPTSTNPDYRSRFIEVPHEPGQRWRVVEECKQVMGTCTMLSPQLLDKLGFYYQMGGLYGFDDSLMCVRSNVAGFMNCFLHGIDIDHIDPGGGPYTEWKQKYSGEMLAKYAQEEAAYKTGVKNVYHQD